MRRPESEAPSRAAPFGAGADTEVEGLRFREARHFSTRTDTQFGLARPDHADIQKLNVCARPPWSQYKVMPLLNQKGDSDRNIRQSCIRESAAAETKEEEVADGFV